MNTNVHANKSVSATHTDRINQVPAVSSKSHVAVDRSSCRVL